MVVLGGLAFLYKRGTPVDNPVSQDLRSALGVSLLEIPWGEVLSKPRHNMVRDASVRLEEGCWV